MKGGRPEYRGGLTTIKKSQADGVVKQCAMELVHCHTGGQAVHHVWCEAQGWTARHMAEIRRRLEERR